LRYHGPMATEEDTPHETPTSKSELHSAAFSADDLTGMGQSDRELLLRWLRQMEQSLQHQIHMMSRRVSELEGDQVRHLESHAGGQRAASDSPGQGEVIFKGRGVTVKGRATWIALLLVLGALVGFAWRGVPYSLQIQQTTPLDHGAAVPLKR
jgi:hypothetical protein